MTVILRSSRMFVATALAVGVLKAMAFDGVVAASGGPDDGPIGIEHRFGTTVLEERPERIVSLDLQWTDALLAVGVTPVAYLHDANAGEDGQFPWQAGMLDESVPIEAVDALPLETIAELDPDLILVGWLGVERADFDRLAALAPTVGLLGDKQVDDWQDQLAVVGDVTGRSDEAADLEENVTDVVETAADDLRVHGRTFALVNYIAGDAFYAVADPEDGASQLFYWLGMEIEPALVDVADGVTGRAELSLEQIGVFAAADVLLMFSLEGDPRDLVGYSELPAVQSGAAMTMSYADVVGLNTPTPLSVLHSLEVVRPVLEAAAVA